MSFWLLLGACIIPPPTPAKPETPRLPPHIQDANTTPQEWRVLIEPEAPETLVFEVSVIDPNQPQPNQDDDSRMYYAFIGNHRGIIGEGSVPDSGTQQIDGETFYTFDLITETIRPCSDPPPSGVETITVYVADRDFTRISQQDPTPPTIPDDAYMVSRSWVLEYDSDACTQ